VAATAETGSGDVVKSCAAINAALAPSPVAPPHRGASRSSAAQYLAHDDAALLLFVLVLIVIILGRVVVAVSRRHAE
jgi:hypothetical protein